MSGLDRSHASLPMLVAQIVSNCIGLSPGTKQTPIVSLGFEIADRQQQQQPEEYHRSSSILIVSPPTDSPLQEKDEIGDVIGHLWG